MLQYLVGNFAFLTMYFNVGDFCIWDKLARSNKEFTDQHVHCGGRGITTSASLAQYGMNGKPIANDFLNQCHLNSFIQSHSFHTAGRSPMLLKNKHPRF